MKAEQLIVWDAVELARILARIYCDADDLFEAFPSLERVDSFDCELLPEFIDRNWQYLLRYYDTDMLESWIEEKEYEEEWEKWRNKVAEDEYDYKEWRLEEYCWNVIEVVDWFHYKDLAELWGHPPKKMLN